MSEAPRRDAGPPPSTEEVRGDEEFARDYAAGYEEGVRSALHEVLGHVTRGHTPQEVRMLVQSRLARLNEEVELKRASLLGPPRRASWGALLRTSPARPWTPPVASSAPVGPRLGPGQSVLLREERPSRAVELLAAHAADFPRVVLVSVRPPALGGPGERVLLNPSVAAEGAAAPTPGEISGRLREPTEAPGGALVYVDALEYLATEHSLEMMLRFVHWLVGQVADTGSALLVSFDPRSLDVKDASRLERAFQTVQ